MSIVADLFAAIATECRDCAGSAAAVNDCDCACCALHRFRNGPHQHPLAQRIAAVTRDLAEAEAVLARANPPPGTRRNVLRMRRYVEKLTALAAGGAEGAS